MKVGDRIKFELFLGRYIDGIIRSYTKDAKGIKLPVEYGIGKVANIRPESIVGYEKVKPFTPKADEPEIDDDLRF
jgi:hypothetical protein